MKRPDPIPGVEIRERVRRDGTAYWVFRVRWKDPVTGRRLVETCESADEALDFKAHLRLAGRRGALDELDMGREILSVFVEEWWERYAKHNLAAATRRTYATIWNVHLLGRVGHLELRRITPAAVDRLKSDLQEDGVGAPTIRKAMSLLQAVLREAVAWDRLRVNPVKEIRKPRAPRQRAVVALSPDQVEQLRAELEHPLDRVLVGVLAYAGLRPEDALALEVRHVLRATLLVEQKNVDGVILAGQKTSRPPRSIDLLGPLRQDLAEYMLASGRRAPRALLFPRPDGLPWREHDYRNWRKRTFKAAVERAGLEITRPYDLRHAFASLLIRDGRLSLAEIADQMGNSVATLSEVYAHVIADMRGQRRVAADVAVQRAQAKRVRGAA